MCLLDLLNDNYTQYGLIAIPVIQMPKQNLEQPNLSLGIIVAVLSHIVVARLYNES